MGAGMTLTYHSTKCNWTNDYNLNRHKTQDSIKYSIKDLVCFRLVTTFIYFVFCLIVVKGSLIYINKY